jgi:Rrf2 family transcriptional regulator, nitric oxide-sensitive transcriptional repressor
LQKIVHELGKSGLVETVRGKNGGITLAKDPQDIGIGIGIGPLIRSLEDMDLVECFTENGQCEIQCACELKSVLHEAQQAFLAVLDRYTLADLLRNKSDLYSLFQQQT